MRRILYTARMLFSELSVSPPLLKSLARRGYEQPTPVQEIVLIAEHRGRDLLVSAQTGSGKTVAFGLALADELLGTRERLAATKKPLALVVAPTRELALQVQRELAWLYAETGAKVVACVGGMDVRREQRALADGAHIVVGTPGRLCDHLEHRSLDVSHLLALVLDEADEMLDMGFRDELERILRDAPVERRTLLFSATIPTGISHLAKNYQRQALRLAASPPRQAHQDIEYRAHLIAVREREHAVVNTLRHLDAASSLVFCATREGVNHLHANLVERGFTAVAISGELNQNERMRALKALRDQRARVLVATDVAARGLDLPALDLVIHADLPRDGHVLQHRSGRTGRAGRKGVSVMLVPMRMRRVAERMSKDAGIELRFSPVASLDEIRALDQERLAAEIALTCAEPAEEDITLARRLLETRSAEQLVSALVRQHRTTLPSPEEMPETGAWRDRDSAPRRERPQTRGERPQVHGARSHASSERPPSHSTRSHAPSERERPRDERSTAPSERSPRRARETEADGVWFRLNVGRQANAEPRWLLPLICRRGGVVKRDIGTIDIGDRETRVLISAEMAKSFAEAVRRPDRKDPSIRIEPVRGA